MPKLAPFAHAAALTVLALSLSATAQEQRPEVGPYVQAYSGDFNSTVHVVRLGAREKAEALVLLSGIDNELDGQVLKTRIVNNGENRRSFMLQQDGKDTEIMRLEGNSGQLHVSSFPFGPSSYRLIYDAKLSGQANAEHILTRWLGQ